MCQKDLGGVSPTHACGNRHTDLSHNCGSGPTVRSELAPALSTPVLGRPWEKKVLYDHPWLRVYAEIRFPAEVLLHHRDKHLGLNTLKGKKDCLTLSGHSFPEVAQLSAKVRPFQDMSYPWGSEIRWVNAWLSALAKEAQVSLAPSRALRSELYEWGPWKRPETQQGGPSKSIQGTWILPIVSQPPSRQSMSL